MAIVQAVYAHKSYSVSSIRATSDIAYIIIYMNTLQQWDVERCH